MNLKELHIKGGLAEKGYLKEEYDETTDDLKHELTELGRLEVREMLKDPIYQRMFIQMVMDETKDIKLARQIIRSAMEKL